MKIGNNWERLLRRGLFYGVPTRSQNPRDTTRSPKGKTRERVVCPEWTHTTLSCSEKVGTTREQLGTSGNECEKFGFLALETTMQNLVTLKDGEPRVSTLSIAEYVDISHASVIKLVRKHQIEFERFGFLGFEIQEKRGTQGSPTQFAHLNEPQTTLLLTFLRNTERVKECKVRIVKEFFEFERFGTIGFEIQKSGGRPTEHANLNEPQTTRAHAREKQGVSNGN